MKKFNSLYKSINDITSYYKAVKTLGVHTSTYKVAIILSITNYSTLTHNPQ